MARKTRKPSATPIISNPTEPVAVVNSGISEKLLIVMSGGLDSTTLAYRLKASKKEVAGIYFDIGYRPRVAERNSARLAAHRLGIPLEVVNLPGIFDMVTGFYPTEAIGLGELDKGQPTPIPTALPYQYVIGIHVLLSLAAYYAQLGNVRTIVTGLTQEQFQTSPALASFIESWSNAVRSLNPERPFTLDVPFREMDKASIIRSGAELGVPFADTWSCLNGREMHCGVCSGCIGRKGGFTASGISDPTRYHA